jgi:pyridoxamine 5'-phosphate oxidase
MSATPDQASKESPLSGATADVALADLRRDYKMASLEESEVSKDPITQFGLWFEAAQKANLLEPNAMTLATVTPEGKPSARIVLLKGFDQDGFCFYSNYQSRKGIELAAHPHACLVFLWQELERQVRIEGRISKLSAAESDLYFQSRPLSSRYGALASPQSQVLPDRQVLIDKEAVLRAQYGESPPRPSHWGGYRVVPEVIEFWQGRRSRLHDRLRFTRRTEVQASPWQIERLAP